ncbi:MAG: ABC transporter permease [Hyphomicrobiaceae bacterium]
MSGSFDRPSALPAPPPARTTARTRPRQEGYTDPNAAFDPIGDQPTYDLRSQHPQTADDYEYGDPNVSPSAPVEPELRADMRPASPRAARIPASASIVPPGSVTGRSLTLVVSIMCFLACLTAGGVYMINKSASAWLRDIASEATVQIEPRDGVDTDRVTKDVVAYLLQLPGIRGVKPMGIDDTVALIEPWLGTSDALKSLPLPRLVAIDLDRSAPPDFADLRKKLGSQFKGVSLDDHRHWQQQIRAVTRSLALGGLAILMLVGAATTAIIISATRSSMSANREIVEVLHFVGATDRFISREFERHFLNLGVRAGLVGAVLATLVFFFMPSVMQLLGGGAVTMAEMHRLVGTGVLDAAGYLVMIVVVFVVAALCMLTSRFGVYRILNSQH